VRASECVREQRGAQRGELPGKLGALQQAAGCIHINVSKKKKKKKKTLDKSLAFTAPVDVVELDELPEPRGEQRRRRGRGDGLQLHLEQREGRRRVRRRSSNSARELGPALAKELGPVGVDDRVRRAQQRRPQVEPVVGYIRQTGVWFGLLGFDLLGFGWFVGVWLVWVGVCCHV
jgi:hypothetical protein